MMLAEHRYALGHFRGSNPAWQNLLETLANFGCHCQRVLVVIHLTGKNGNGTSKSYLAIFQPDALDLLVRAETSDVEIIDAHVATALQQEEAVQMRMFSRKLHYLLANLCTGSARLLVRQTAAGNPFETWRRLSQRFSFPAATRHVSLVTKILEWKFNTQTFEQDFNAWDTINPKYEQ